PLLEKLNVEGAKVLDVGCNEGYFSFQIADMGAKKVVGLDIDNLRIEKAQFAKQFYHSDSVFFLNQDIYSSDFDKLGRFDLTWCTGFLHRIPDPFRALDSIGQLSDTLILEWKVLRQG